MKGGMPNELLVTSNGIFEYIRICKCQFELKFYVWPQKWIMIFEGFFSFLDMLLYLLKVIRTFHVIQNKIWLSH